MTLGTVIFGLFALFVIILLVKTLVMFHPIVETETVIHHHDEDGDERPIVGKLERRWEGGQPFVIDPVDQKKIWINTNDDMYEDADDKVWRLV